MREFVIGDIHGGYNALMQCFDRSGFNKKEDKLVVLGDVVDGWPDVKEVVEELLSCDHVISVIGNHDWWFMQWVKTLREDSIWTSQGGAATLKSYAGDLDLATRHYDEYFAKCKDYYLDENNNLFVHGGIDWHKPIEEQSLTDLMWDRHMYETAFWWKHRDQDYKFGDYQTVFIGHTTTQYSPARRLGAPGSTEPMFYSNLIALDTGGGWSGKLTIMDINTKEYWQSELVPTLYPGIKGR